MQTIDVEFLLATYDALFLDAYGVLVDAHGVLPGAPAFVRRLVAAGMPFAVVTNDAAKSLERIATRFAGFDLPIAQDRIVSSASLLADFIAGHALTGERALVLGPPDAHAFVAAAGARPSAPSEVGPAGAEVAAVIVCDVWGDMHEALSVAINAAIRRLDAGRPLALVLCNPDIIYPAGDAFGITSGALMAVIEQALKSRYQPSELPPIARLGKPYPEIFRAARRLTGGQRLALLGDQLPTDVRGALDYGIDAVLVGTGLTRVKPGHVLNPMPSYYLPSVAHLGGHTP